MTIQNLDLLAVFDKDISDIPTFPMAHPNFDEADFTKEQFGADILERQYCCEWGHDRLSPVLMVHTSSYNPNTSSFEMQGKLLVGCAVCGRPVKLNEPR